MLWWYVFCRSPGRLPRSVSTASGTFTRTGLCFNLRVVKPAREAEEPPSISLAARLALAYDLTGSATACGPSHLTLPLWIPPPPVQVLTKRAVGR
jgi:hypothetical protein